VPAPALLAFLLGLMRRLYIYIIDIDKYIDVYMHVSMHVSMNHRVYFVGRACRSAGSSFTSDPSGPRAAAVSILYIYIYIT